MFFLLNRNSLRVDHGDPKSDTWFGAPSHFLQVCISCLTHWAVGVRVSESCPTLPFEATPQHCKYVGFCLEQHSLRVEQITCAVVDVEWHIQTFSQSQNSKISPA